MKFSARRCLPSRQGIKARLDAASTYHGVSLRLLLVDKQVDAEDVLPNAALGSVHVVRYNAHATTLAELIALIREAHRQNGAPFLSIAIAQHGADSAGRWAWATDLTVSLKNMHGAMDQLAPVIEVLAAALAKTRAGKAHIDLLACGLATTCKGLVPALEKMYGIDFRASTDDTGNAINGGDWKMETDSDYDVAADYLDAGKLKAYAEKMGLLDTVRRSIIHAARHPFETWCRAAVLCDDFLGARGLTAEALFDYNVDGAPEVETPEAIVRGIIAEMEDERREAFSNRVADIPLPVGWVW